MTGSKVVDGAGRGRGAGVGAGILGPGAAPGIGFPQLLQVVRWLKLTYPQDGHRIVIPPQNQARMSCITNWMGSQVPLARIVREEGPRAMRA